MRISNYLFMVAVLSALSFSCSEKPKKKQKPYQPLIFDSLVWADEFDGEGDIDPNKWNYSIGDGCPRNCGWGNNELQYYTDNSANVRLNNGFLILETHRDSIHDRGFTSGKIHTRNKAYWKYGKFEIRAKLPSTLGSWPAIWMLPQERKYGNWPRCGEIDIMENVGYDPDTVLSTIHTGAYNHLKNTHKSGKIYLPDCDEEFHVYSLEWDEVELRFFVDNEKIFTYLNEQKSVEEWPFDQPFYLILNIAFGGSLGGAKGVNPDGLPIRMEVDYVRVYQ